MKTLIAGLGNSILGDDGAGWVVAQNIAKLLNGSIPSICVDCFDIGGLALMEQLIGFEGVIIIDSIYTGRHAQGKLTSFTLDTLPEFGFGHSASTHDLSLKKAFDLGHRLELDLPNEKNVWIVAIETDQVFEFSEKLTPEVEACIPLAIQEVFRLIERY